MYANDHSMPDTWVTSTHHYYDVVVGDSLVTAVKDEGATETFMSSYLVDRLSMGEKVEPPSSAAG